MSWVSVFGSIRGTELIVKIKLDVELKGNDILDCISIQGS